MNIYFVSYSADAPEGLPFAVLADTYLPPSSGAPGGTVKFRVNRPVSSSSKLTDIVVLKVPADWVMDVQAVGALDGPPAVR